MLTPFPRTGQTILFVDDDPDVIWSTTRMLVQAGYAVVNGSSAAEALALTRRHHPALVLLDVELPDGNGIDVARQMKEDPELAGVFVVLVSGVRITPQQQAQGLSLGLADGYLVRPFTKVEFLARVESFLRIRETQAALQQSERQFRQMAESIDEVFWLMAPGGEAVLYVSPAFERIWGRSCAELYASGEIWSESILPEDLPRVRHDMARLMRGASIEMEYRIRCPDGTLRWINDRGYPLSDGSGKLAGVASDITRRKEAEEARNVYAGRLITQEEELRKRISLELHDDIGQVLAVLGLNLGHIGQKLPPESPSELKARLEESQGLTREATRTVRQLMGELRPLLLDDFGLAEALRLFIDQFARRSGLAATLVAAPAFPRLGPKQELALFRIVQEALHNVLRHAQAQKAVVRLTREAARVRVSIVDDGRGFSPSPTVALPDGSGWGITLMRERAALADGRFRIDSAPGAGTRVEVELAPCPESSPAPGAHDR